MFHRDCPLYSSLMLLGVGASGAGADAPSYPADAVYLDQASGDDMTAEIGNPALPFATLDAAFQACVDAMLTDCYAVNVGDSNSAYGLALPTGTPQVTILTCDGTAWLQLSITQYSTANYPFEVEVLTDITEVGHTTEDDVPPRTELVTYSGSGTIGSFYGGGGAGGDWEPGDAAASDDQSGDAGDLSSSYAGYPGGSANGSGGNEGGAGHAASPFHFTGSLTINSLIGRGGDGGRGQDGGSAIANGGPATDDGMGTPANGGNGGFATGGAGGYGGLGGTGGTWTYSAGVTIVSSNMNGGAGGAGGTGGAAEANGGAGINGGSDGSGGSPSAGSDGSPGSTGSSGTLTLV